MFLVSPEIPWLDTLAELMALLPVLAELGLAACYVSRIYDTAPKVLFYILKVWLVITLLCYVLQSLLLLDL